MRSERVDVCVIVFVECLSLFMTYWSSCDVYVRVYEEKKVQFYGNSTLSLIFFLLPCNSTQWSSSVITKHTHSTLANNHKHKHIDTYHKWCNSLFSHFVWILHPNQNRICVFFIQLITLYCFDWLFMHWCATCFECNLNPRIKSKRIKSSQF